MLAAGPDRAAFDRQVARQLILNLQQRHRPQLEVEDFTRELHDLPVFRPGGAEAAAIADTD